MNKDLVKIELFVLHLKKLVWSFKILCSTKTQNRLNHLMICAIYHEYLDTLDIEELAKVFVLRKSRENMFEIPKK